MTGAAVTVTDRIPYSAVVSPEQAVAYCRRILLPRRYREEPWRGPGGRIVFWAPPHYRDGGIIVGGDADEAGARYIAEACDALSRLGIASRPSDVLRAMAETTV